jgi:hypothetical protein
MQVGGAGGQSVLKEWFDSGFRIDRGCHNTGSSDVFHNGRSGDLGGMRWGVICLCHVHKPGLATFRRLWHADRSAECAGAEARDALGSEGLAAARTRGSRRRVKLRNQGFDSDVQQVETVPMNGQTCHIEMYIGTRRWGSS